MVHGTNKKTTSSMESPFKPIWDIINSGTNAERMERLPDFPRIIDLELTNDCNLRCLMCPTGMNTSIRKRGYIGTSNIIRVVQECAKYNTPIRLIRWGEPMLHPCCFRTIRRIKTYGLMCHMNTNGTLMDFDAVKDIISSGLDSIKFSFQGLDKAEYERWRQGGDYVELCGWIKFLFVQRNRRRKRHPHIQVGTTTTSADDTAIAEFRESMGKICDLVTVGKTQNIISPSESKTTPTCPEVFDRLSVNWDGTVTACCRDYDNQLLLGNIKEQTLEEMWHGDTINHIRKCLVAGEHNKLPMCRSCFL